MEPAPVGGVNFSLFSREEGGGRWAGPSCALFGIVENITAVECVLSTSVRLGFCFGARGSTCGDRDAEGTAGPHTAPLLTVA